MGEMKLGQIITDPQERDAIHIAVAPVIAGEELRPGQHVGFWGDGEQRARSEVKNYIGIVDPFLKEPVRYGQKFWLFLYPNTITALKHQWAHPAFGDPMPGDPTAESKRWIADFAADIEQTYNSLMRAAALWVDCEDYTYDNSESYKDIPSERWREFWRHYEIATGTKVEDHEGYFFTCSC